MERLELYVSSGLPLDHSLRVSGEGVTKKQTEAIEKVRKSVEAGGTLSQALVTHLKISKTIAALIGNGEESGELAKALGRAKDLLEREEELTKKCVSAMIYPVVIGLFAGVLTIGLVRGVMPQIVPMLKGLNVQLPLITRVVMAISDGMVKYGFVILVSIIVIASGFPIVYWKSRLVRGAFQSLLARVPMVGRLFRLYHLSLFVRSLGLLAESGAPAASAYPATVSTLSFAPVRDQLEKERVNIKNGHALGLIMARMKGMPPYLAPLVSAGEASGTLGASLICVARIMDRDIEHALKRVTSLLEPVMMAAMGCAVGAIALSIVMPIYDISKVLQQ